MKKITRLLLENKAWAAGKKLNDPDYFKKMATSQTPEYLWIGCSDSRVPPDEITNTDPGELFVHRNIANLIIATDLNLLSVVQYAIEVLKVSHVIICGHYDCGGVKAALEKKSLGPIDNWIRNIRFAYAENKEMVDALKTQEERVNKLVELNVLYQVKNLSYTAVVQKAWENRRSICLHGWVYDLNTGLIKEIVQIDKIADVAEAHRYI